MFRLFGYLTGLLILHDNFSALKFLGASKPLLLIFLPFYLYLAFKESFNYKIDVFKFLLISVFCMFVLSLLSFFSVIQSPFTDFKGVEPLSRFISGLISFWIFFINFVVAFFLMGNSVFRRSFLYGVFTQIPVLFLISVVELLVFKYNLNDEIFLNTLFLDRGVVFDRSSLLSLEPAWAQQGLLLVVAPVLLISYYEQLLSRILLLIFSVLFIATIFLTSSPHIYLVIFSLIVWFSAKSLLRLISSLKVSKFYLYLSFVGFCLALVFLYSPLFQYQMAKINLITTNGIWTEPSTAVRLGLPYISLLVFLDKGFLFGIGVSQFGFYIPDFIPDFLVGVGEFKAIVDPTDSYFATSRSLLLRILVEFGLLGFTVFIAHMIIYFANLHRYAVQVNLKLVVLYFLMIVVVSFLLTDTFVNMQLGFISFFLYHHIRHSSVRNFNES